MSLYQSMDRVGHGGLCLLTSSPCFALPERQSISRTLRRRIFLYESNTTVRYVLKYLKRKNETKDTDEYLVNSKDTRNSLTLRGWIVRGIKKSRRRCRDVR